MRMSFRNLLAVLVLGTVTTAKPTRAKAQDSNSPTQSGAPNQAVGREPTEALRVEDMTMDELKQRLAEYEAGKRGDRDGYIIANQLWFNYRGRKEVDIPEAQHVNEVLQGILEGHPEYRGLQDFQLSDRLNYFAKKEREKKQAQEAAKNWVPPDNVPTMIMVNDQHAVGVFQFHLDFFNLPQDVQMTPKGKLARQGHDITLSELHPVKTMSFVHSIETLPNSNAIPPRFLACTSMLHDHYNRMTAEEEKSMAALGHRYAMPWTNKKAKQEQMCAVLSIEGDVVFSFGPQHVPNKLFSPLDFSPDGKKAVVALGEKTFEQGEDGSSWEVGTVRAILVWTEGKGLKTIPLSDKTMGRWQVLYKYRLGQLGNLSAP